MIAVYLAIGFEEIEALATVDILRRANLETLLVSTEDNLTVTGSHSIQVQCDAHINDLDANQLELAILPGGLPGATRLDANPMVREHIRILAEKRKPLAAICAAPMILGKMGLLHDREATAFPGFEQYLEGATLSHHTHLVSKGVFTARGAGMALDFAFDLVEHFRGKDFADQLAQKMIFKRGLL